MTTRAAAAPPTHRSSLARLDPYAVDATMTLQEFRKIRSSVQDVHVVVPESDRAAA
jgi:hypothetical protein